MEDNVDGEIFAKIPLGQLSIAEASDQVEDPSFFYTTRAPILFHYSQLTPNTYWDLTVLDHRALWDFIVSKGLV